MLRKVLVGVVGAVLVAAPPVASAQPSPEPAPPPQGPNINAYPPVKTSEYAVDGGTQYAFTTTEGLTCIIQRSGAYGCNGVLPGAPEGANLVSGRTGGVPGFATVGPPTGNPPRPLPANSRLSFSTVSCGSDGVTTSCLDGSNQAGFVVGPGGSFILGEVNPLLDRPEGTNPYTN
jgi:hypothetical protein